MYKNGDGSFEKSGKEEDEKRTFISLKTLTICLNEISDPEIML